MMVVIGRVVDVVVVVVVNLFVGVVIAVLYLKPEGQMSISMGLTR
jgi:hypothetical protein